MRSVISYDYDRRVSARFGKFRSASLRRRNAMNDPKQITDFKGDLRR